MNKKGLVGVFAFAATASANNITAGIVAYIMATYSEVSTTTVAMIMTMPAVVGTVFAFVSGSLINKIGAKKVTIGIHFLEFVSGLIFLFFGNKTNIYILWFASALYGFLMGGATVVIGQLLAQNVADDKKRSVIYGYSSSIMSLGGVFFASVGGVIAAKNGGIHWENAYILYFLILISLALEWICLPNDTPEKKIEEKTVKEKQTMPSTVWLISFHYAFFFLFLYAFSLNASEYVITTHQLGTSVEAGLAVSCVTVGGIVSGAIYGVYSNLFKKYTVPFLMLLTSIGLALTVFVPNIMALYVAAVLMGFAMMGCGPYILGVLAKKTNEKQYPTAMSIFSGFMNVGMMIAVYVLAFMSNLIFQDPTSVDGKLMIAFVGSLIVLVTSIPLYTK